MINYIYYSLPPQRVILSDSEVLRVKHRVTSKTCVYAGIYDGVLRNFPNKSYFLEIINVNPHLNRSNLDSFFQLVQSF